MRALPIAVVLATTLATAASASADPIGPAFDFSTGGGLYTGAIGDEAGSPAPHLRVGAGVARSGWAALLSVEMPTIFDLKETTPSSSQGFPMAFIGVGLGPSIRRELTRGAGLRLHVRLGYTMRWLRGDGEVTRTCDHHGGCDGGFWTETPSYTAHGPTIAFGIGGRFNRRGLWTALGVELHASHLTVDRLGRDPDLRGTYVGLGVNVAIGRGAE